MCPCCEEETLHQNGGFWLCTTCGLAITEQALAYERMSQVVGGQPATPSGDR